MNEEKFNYILDLANGIKKIQAQSGNYDYDDYMHGLYNGMEMIISLFEQREPVFIDGHDIKFINDKNKQLEAYENMRKEAIEYIKNDMKLKNYFEITERGAEDLLNILNKVGGDNE